MSASIKTLRSAIIHMLRFSNLLKKKLARKILRKFAKSPSNKKLLEKQLESATDHSKRFAMVKAQKSAVQGTKPHVPPSMLTKDRGSLLVIPGARRFLSKFVEEAV